jgi:hypothetical protein
MPKSRLVVVLVVLAATLAFGAGNAAAKAPCWKTLLNDWYDGRIDNTYPIHCYKDALRHLPADVQTYSSAHDDILRALQSAQARLRKAGKAVTPNTPVPPSSGGTSGKGKNGKPHKPKPKPSGGGKDVTTTSTSPGRHPGGGLDGAAASSGSSPSSVPVPLLVLGGLALLLVAAGAAGLIAKRRHGRGPSS